MNTYLSRIIVIFVIISLLVSSCGAPPTPLATPTEELDLQATGTAYAQATSDAFLTKYNLGIAITGDEKFGIIATHTSGEKLAVMTQQDQNGDFSPLNGAIWLSPDEHAVVVFSGADGLPERAVVEGFVLIFSNYTRSSVDVTVVSPDKKIEIVRGVELNENDILELRELSQSILNNGIFTLASYPPVRAEGGKDVIKLIRGASILINIVTCIAAFGGTFATFGALAGTLALGCGGLIISAISFWAADNPALVGSSVFFNLIGCLDVKTAALCLAGILDTFGMVAEASTQISSDATSLLESPPEIEPSKLVLDKNYYCRTGPDSSYPDVTGFFPGKELDVIGQYNGWYLVDIEKEGIQSKFKSCWIGGGEVVGGDLSAIPVVQPSNPAPGTGPSKNKPDKPNQPPGSSYP